MIANSSERHKCVYSAHVVSRGLIEIDRARRFCGRAPKHSLWVLEGQTFDLAKFDMLGPLRQNRFASQNERAPVRSAYAKRLRLANIALCRQNLKNE